MIKTVITAAFLLIGASLSAFAWASETPSDAQEQADSGSVGVALTALDPEQHFLIASVVYHGNRVTKTRLLNQQLLFKAPAEASGANLATSIQSIRDLGLFESVVAELQPQTMGYQLSITLEEKFYIIPLPRLGLNSDGETSYGASLEWDNIGGLNQRLKFVWERKQLQDESLGEREVFRLNYDYPRIAGSFWNGGVFLSDSRVPVEETLDSDIVNYVQLQQRHGFSIGRQLSSIGQTSGWFVGGEFFYLLRDNKPRSEVPALAGGDTLAVAVSADYIDRRLYTYTDEGSNYSLRIETSLPSGQYQYNQISAKWRKVKAGVGEHHSFIREVGASVFNGGIAGQYEFGNNSDTLRGLKKGELEGNALVYATLEYLLPIFKRYPGWRYGGFVDMALFGKDYSDFGGSELNYSAGVLLVWRPKRLVKVELRGEMGYNINSGSKRFGGGLTRF